MWRRIGDFFHNLWNRIIKRSIRKDTLLDTARLKLFGLDITLTRELPRDVPYELTLIVPRAEYRNGGHCPPECRERLEVLLNSITIAHSPRRERESKEKSA
jgi:hypothetical protein